MKKFPPWPILEVILLGLLTAVNKWREATGFETFAIFKGSAPNLLAVPILCFGVFLFIYQDKREIKNPEAERKLNRNFAFCLGGSALVNIAWEFLQIGGNLVFDMNDILFIGLGVCLSFAVFGLLRPMHFLSEPVGGKRVGS